MFVYINTKYILIAEDSKGWKMILEPKTLHPCWLGKLITFEFHTMKSILRILVRCWISDMRALSH